MWEMLIVQDGPEILEEAKKYMISDSSKLESTKNGTINRAWVEKALINKEFEMIDDVYNA